MSRIPLTRFFCQELLFDYLTSHLQPDRQKEVEEYLQYDEVCREDLKRLMLARTYCRGLAHISPPDSWIERWRNLPPALAKRITDWEHKFIERFWVGLPYVVVTLVVGLSLFIFQPWKSFYEKEIVLWVAPPTEKVTPAPATPTVEPSVPVAQAEPEKKVETPAVPHNPSPSASKIVATKETLPPVAKSDQPPVSATPAEPKAPPVTAPPISQEAQEGAEDDAIHDKSQTAAFKGIVFRAFMDVSDLKQATDQIKDKIAELGGEKARKAELGWFRKPTESYFHFTLPESNQESLVQFLSAMSPVRISKDKHPVVMPSGKIRIILVVRENANHVEEETTP